MRRPSPSLQGLPSGKRAVPAAFAVLAGFATLVVLAMLVALAGCAERRDPADISIQAHPAAWNVPTSPDFHGARVAQSGIQFCQGCHAVTAKRATEAPSCFECHDGPGGHPALWQEPEAETFHGKAIANTGIARCRRCHGDSLDGGWSHVGCYNSCHANPSGHPAGWIDAQSPEFHGSTVAGNSAAACRACHGEDLRGGWSEVGCSGACHAGPGGHPAGWRTEDDAAFHGSFVAANGFERCGLCHGTDFAGGWSAVSCSQCHDGPSGHPAAWMDDAAPGFHGEAVATNSFDRCKVCHGADVRGGWSGIGCYGACHNGPGGHPVGWIDEDSPNFHWDYIRQVGSNNECRRCHGSALGGGWSGIDCESCHV